MTKDRKWLAVGGMAIVAFYLGWAFPWLWLVVAILIIVILLTPTIPDNKSNAAPILPLNAVEQTRDDTELRAVESSLIQALDREQNAEVRRGIELALETVRQHMSSLRVATASPVVAQQVMPEPVFEPALDPVAVAESKEKQELRNINMILYVASFLLVGAAALFIGFTSGIDSTGKFFALVLVTLAFYCSGLVLHHTMPKIRPAAVAFVGTGLALIPFVGLGLYNYILPDASLAWWLTSVVGIIAFWTALLVIRTELMSYLTLAFVFSLTTSTVSVLDAAFVWYFVAVIVTSSIMLLVAHRSPNLVPSEMRIPLEQNSQLAAPLALVGSLVAGGNLALADYVLISGVGALHYGVSALGYPEDKPRYLNWSLARLLTIAFATLLTHYLTDSWAWTGVTIVAAALLSHIYAVLRINQEARESAWFWISQALVVLGVILWLDDFWNVSFGLVLLAIISAHQLRVMRRSEYAIGLLGAAALLPLTVGRGAMDPVLEYKVLALWALLTAFMFFTLRLVKAAAELGYRQTAQAGYTLLSLEAVVLACVNPDPAWTAGIFIAVALLVYYSAFVERQPLLHIVSNLAAVIGTYLLLREAGISSVWLPLATGWLLGMLWYVLRWYHELYSDEEPDQTRIDIMFVSSVTILLLAAFYGALANGSTVIAGSLTGLAAAGLIAAEGRHRNMVSLYEMALVIATLSLQWLVRDSYPDANLLFYTHWWALTLALIGLLRLHLHDREGAKLRGILAMAAVSVPTGLYALSDPSTYQYLFLLEHVALLIGGFVMQRKLVIKWAAVAIGLALLWMLSSYTYVLLVVIALGLIALAIWRLVKKS